MVAFPPLPEPLTDGVVALRPTAERDIPEVLVAYERDRDLPRALDEEHPPSGAVLGRRSERADALWNHAREITLTVLARSSDTCRGELRVRRIEPETARCVLFLWLAPSARGQGLGARVLRLAARWLIDSCGFVRLGWVPEAGNAPARAAAERAGFQYEGELRGYTAAAGGRVDHAVYSYVAGDP
jgi:RimJ/RimL family protein N-acetyltransferase